MAGKDRECARDNGRSTGITSIRHLQIEISQFACSLPNSVKFGSNGVDFIVMPFIIHGHVLPSVNSQNNDAAQNSDDSFQDATWLIAVHFHREENCSGRHLCCHVEPLGGQGSLSTPIGSRLSLL